MKIFRDIKLEWDGQPVAIKGDDNIMTLIRKIEEVATISELQLYLSKGGMSISMLCEIYSVILNHGGAEVSTPEVYNVFSVAAVDPNILKEAIANVILMCLPEKVLQETDKEISTEDKNPKNSQKQNSRPKSKKRKAKASQ